MNGVVEGNQLTIVRVWGQRCCLYRSGSSLYLARQMVRLTPGGDGEGTHTPGTHRDPRPF